MGWSRAIRSDAIVFVGPTISVAVARSVLSAGYAPPAEVGDIYRAVRLRVRAIGLIDGYYERVPSPWHKEIVFALSQGILVYGAASLGAIRAAECARYGMIGVGRVFSDYLTGRLEDDDDVALSHLPTGDFSAVSEPMVNFRATVARAVRSGIVTEGLAEDLVAVAKDMSFFERTYEGVSEVISSRVASTAELHRFLDWVSSGGAVDVKRADALLMLNRISRDLAFGARSDAPSFTFPLTQAWKNLVRAESARARSDWMIR